MNQHVITSPDKESTVVIDQGELISYSRYGEELIHQKGDPGWRNADTEMFPVIGPTEGNNFSVSTQRGNAIQDQHGLLRELNYQLTGENDHALSYNKVYQKNTKVPNSKFPDKSPKELVSWPYDFSFSKEFNLDNEGLRIIFTLKGELGMPFMLGYHPAFKLSGHLSEKIEIAGEEISIQDIMDAGSIAYPALKTNEIQLLKKQGYHIKITTKGFNNFMLWTEVPNMICIEPITAYPYTGEKQLEKELFKSSTGLDVFEVVISPFE